jgi:DNA topoisomerase-1
MPALREGDAPVKTGVEASQHSPNAASLLEASLVKRLEGRDRPSVDLCSHAQTLKDREYVRPRRVDSFQRRAGGSLPPVERFFERYVNYDYGRARRS